MEVKGTAFLARRAMLIREIGEERFATFLRVISEQEPVFREPITAATSIPIRAFLRFNDGLVKDIYHGDVNSLWRFGERSAEWAFSQGPQKALLASKNLESFVAEAVNIYADYFSEGSAEAEFRDGVVELSIQGIPREFRHLYLEYSIAGYFKRGLELTSGKTVAPRRIRGFATGDADALYQFKVVG